MSYNACTTILCKFQLKSVIRKISYDIFKCYVRKLLSFTYSRLFFGSKQVLYSGMTKFLLKLAPSRESEISALNCTTIPTHIF